MNASNPLELSDPITKPAVRRKPHFGARLSSKGVEYGGWFPLEKSVDVLVWTADGSHRVLRTRRSKDGYHKALDTQGLAGDEYMFRKDGDEPFPDPAARAVTQLHGRCVVVASDTFTWTDQGWQRPHFRDLVIYELHVGTFTPEGTFQAAISKLPHLKELGVNAVELMPIGEFPGERNWGYDGVLLYAPAKAYGTPDDLKALVNAAHEAGIAVILDVVYNHLGPDGNYLPACTRQFFSQQHETPWGKGFNFDGPSSKPVRRFFLENPAYWMEDFHMDGFRLDAAHAIIDSSRPHILDEMSRMVRGRGGYITAEDERNEATLLARVRDAGYDMNAVWADDFHHSVRVALTGDRNAYFQDFKGTPEEFVDVMSNGWLYRGQHSTVTGKNRGTECAYLPPCKFIHCITNHDQVGNRAYGDRLSSSVCARGYRALSALICLTPYTPLLFMGQEWAASTPFQFFTDHNAELGPLVTEGRRKEFAGFAEFSDPGAVRSVPDPQDPETFLRSRLNWGETNTPPHRQVLDLYRECLRLRHKHGTLRPLSRDGWMVSLIHGAVIIRFQDAAASFTLLINLWGPCSGNLHDENSALIPMPLPWQVVLSSNDVRFGGEGAGFDPAAQSFTFEGPEVVLLKS